MSLSSNHYIDRFLFCASIAEFRSYHCLITIHVNYKTHESDYYNSHSSQAQFKTQRICLENVYYNNKVNDVISISKVEMHLLTVSLFTVLSCSVNKARVGCLEGRQVYPLPHNSKRIALAFSASPTRGPRCKTITNGQPS